jgi:PadR family transcriptional regulator PadR
MPRCPDTSPQTVQVLDALLDQPETWRYGYDLSKQTRLPSGTLYPILRRLADRGLLTTRWEPPRQPGRPARHVYRLTAEGVQTATARVAAQAAAARHDTVPRPALGGSA